MKIYVIAFLAGCVLTMILGKFVLAELRKLKAGQEIRQDGPTWHNSKAGTPTMGGIAFILGSGIVTFACGWQQMMEGNFAHLYVYLFALIFGLIGFVDDYRKVRQHQNEGLTAKQKFVLQLLAAVVFLFLMRYEGLLTNDLYIPFVNVTVTVNWIVYLVFAAFGIVCCVRSPKPSRRSGPTGLPPRRRRCTGPIWRAAWERPIPCCLSSRRTASFSATPPTIWKCWRRGRISTTSCGT